MSILYHTEAMTQLNRTRQFSSGRVGFVKPTSAQLTNLTLPSALQPQVEEASFYHQLLLCQEVQLGKESMEDLVRNFDSKEEECQFLSEVSFYRGRFAEATRLCKGVETDSTFSLSNLFLTALINASQQADLTSGIDAVDEFAQTHFDNASVQQLADIAKTVLHASAYLFDSCPDWFKRGDFSTIPTPLKKMVLLAYLRYLQQQSKFDRMMGICQAACDFSPESFTIIDLQLEVMYAVAATATGEQDHAMWIMTRVMEPIVSYGFEGIVAEHLALLHKEVSGMIGERYPAAYKKIRREWKRRQTIMTTTHNDFTGKNLCPDLSLEEVRVANLFNYGYAYKEIAEKLSVSVATVNNTLQHIRNKTGHDSVKEALEANRLFEAPALLA